MTPRQFETVLRIRRHRRDELRRFVAKVMSEGRVLNEQIGQLDKTHGEALMSLQRATSQGAIDVDRAALLRRHTLQLTFERTLLAQHVASHAERLKATQALLVKADTDVKAVERLQERFEAIRRLEAQRLDDREATDRFSATTRHGGSVESELKHEFS